jgi:hypothetical protein
MFSAALIAFVETLDIDDTEKNRLCQVVPLPEKPIDWRRMRAVVMMNQYQWSRVDALKQWLEAARLDGFAGRLGAAGKTDPTIYALGQRFKAAALPAAARLQALLAGGAVPAPWVAAEHAAGACRARAARCQAAGQAWRYACAVSSSACWRKSGICQ